MISTNDSTQPVAQADRRGHPVHRSTRVGRRRRVRGLGADRHPHRTRQATGCCAVPGISGASVRGPWPGSAPAELQTHWAATAVAGDKVLTVAPDGELGEAPVQATSAGGGFRLTGSSAPRCPSVRWPTHSGSRRNRFGRDGFPRARLIPGVSVAPLQTTGPQQFRTSRSRRGRGRPDRVVGGAEVLNWLRTHRAVGLTAYQLGVLQRALELTAEYARTREQFDRPIGSFQAVAQRPAEGYIDPQGLRLTCSRPVAAVRGSAVRCRGRDGGVLGRRRRDTASPTPPCTSTAVGHRHGPSGAPVLHHRQETEFALGATAQLRVIGRELADTPA